MTDLQAVQTELVVGPSVLEAYSRLSYTMWYAMAEFIDNSTQSRLNYSSIVDDVLAAEGQPLIVEIDHNRLTREITIKDNSIGMRRDDLIAALRIAQPTVDSKGRSRYGMGMKTAACWIGRKWKVITCEWDSGEEWTAEIDVEGIARRGEMITLTPAEAERDKHYTHIVISGLHRNIQRKTEDTIKRYLGSMYRFDIEENRLKLLYNGEEIKGPEEYNIDTDPDGRTMRRVLPRKEINGKVVTGWIAVLRKGGRRFGGFSLFQEKRQIQGFPNAWKPRDIFGGIEDEGANNLIAQRLMGVIELEGFQVSHTKDAVLFEGDEEEELEKFLADESKDFRDYAAKRRGAGSHAWTRDKVRDLLDEMKKEFGNSDLGDAVANSLLPPLQTIIRNGQQQLASLAPEEKIATYDVTNDLHVVVWLSSRSENDPHLTIVTGSEAGTIHVIINGLHPYYCSLESVDAMDECLRQYIYDAIAEYRVSKLSSTVTPESVRRIKNDLLRVEVVRATRSGTDTPAPALDAIPENDATSLDNLS